ncbi:uncharacterized protein BDZ99DRAFT_463270 [Mytilinidion resinicola]|uniref:ATPase AAA-type core domain-containing protein n=1 Tax=Mytilinidion resinicola TaxID=574789 RepID=A0A6A6YNP8_9PEZI|nr:uncharacterized protein BDZ99DRAFT_463270 [Mytilinidion resinicola]KAF2809487.1 hypothetical protein BDZ99DRAFT_463270 [Mytilinidion resinicola]
MLITASPTVGAIFYGVRLAQERRVSGFALAGYLKYDLRLISLSAVNDNALLEAFGNLEGPCVVVLEDVDSAGITHENAKKGNNSAKLTLSGLLNAIDGNAAPENRPLIMRSNCPEALDDALTRPGRIYRQIYFSHIAQPSAAIYKRLVARLVARDGVISKQEIEPLAKRFAEQIPKNSITPAELQNTCRCIVASQCELSMRSVHGWPN